MKSSKYESLWVGVIYFLILLGIALWVRDIQNQPDTFTTTLQQVIKTSSMGDPASFATAAIDIAENGWISSGNDWIFNLWPPGFVLLEALIIKTFGSGAPVILVLQILAAVLFAFVLVLLNAILFESLKRKVVAFIMPLLIFVFPMSRVCLLEPTGITLGESFAIGFFLMGILTAYRSVTRNSIRYAVYAGLCLALSAYFRSQFEIILLALTGWGILWVLAVRLTSVQKSIEPKLINTTIRTLAVILMVSHAATLPWRIYHLIYQGSPLWVHTVSVTFGNSVMTSAYLESVGGGFVVAGGGNLVCRINPATCGDRPNAKRLFIETFIKHPVEWYSLKLDVIKKYWFSSVQNWSAVGVAPTLFDLATNFLFIIALLALAVLSFTRKVRAHQSWVLLMWFNVSLFSAYVLIFTVQQFEVRYFYFPKIAGMVMLMIVASLVFRPLNNVDLDK